MGDVPFADRWSDLAVGRRFWYDGAGLTEVRASLEREIEALGSTYSGTPASLAAVGRGLAENELFGIWRTAIHLRGMHEVALRGSLAIADAITRDLTSFVQGLRHTYENYRHSEEASAATVIALQNGSASAGVTPVGPNTPPHSAAVGPDNAHPGALRVPDPLLLPVEDCPIEITWELQRLHGARAWVAHYQMSQAYRAAGDFQQVLGERLRRNAEDLAAAWNSRAATSMQRALERIRTTIRVQEVDLHTLGVASNATGEALEETLRSLPAYPAHEVYLLARQLNARYLEAMSQYPRSLKYHLPFDQPHQLGGSTPPPDWPGRSSEPTGDSWFLDDGQDRTVIQVSAYGVIDGS
jgi:hypothetical protein